MENINYFSILQKSQEKFPINRRIKVQLKDYPKLHFKDIILEHYVDTPGYSEFEIFIDELSLTIQPLIKLSNGLIIKEGDISILLTKRLQINLYFIFDFIKFLD